MKIYNKFNEEYQVIRDSYPRKYDEYVRVFAALLEYKKTKHYDVINPNKNFFDKIDDFLRKNFEFNNKMNYYLNNTKDKFLFPDGDLSIIKNQIVIKHEDQINYKSIKYKMLTIINEIFANFFNRSFVGQDDYIDILKEDFKKSLLWKENSEGINDVFKVIDDLFGKNKKTFFGQKTGIFFNKDLKMVLFYNNFFNNNIWSVKEYITTSESQDYLDSFNSKESFEQILNKIYFPARNLSSINYDDDKFPPGTLRI